MKLGDKIRVLIEVRGATLTEVSTATNISLSYLSDIQRCKRLPSLEIAAILARYFGVSMSELLRNVDIL